jgi:hypothetical protein
MHRLICILVIAAASVLAIGIDSRVQAQSHDDDEYWGGYWRDHRPHPIRYAPYEPTLYYGHAPAARYRAAPLYPRRDPAIGSYHPIYGPGRYYGPSIAPYYAPGRDTYGGVRYGWW